MIEKGSWVSIRRTLLEPASRTGRLPDETKETPFVMWVKGRLEEAAEIGAPVAVITRTGRRENGVLEAVNPQYQLDYGDFTEELLFIDDQARKILFGGDARG
ncbi:MAG: 2-amino-4-ketopentanoate thiolase [Clostridiales bacterium]|jgi:hypothetical protein|nr:2-amino-4-ketopentanoate thiolase [Clostridiales bacterium]